MEALTGWRKLLCLSSCCKHPNLLNQHNNTRYFMQPPRMSGTFGVWEWLIIHSSRQTTPIMRVSGAGMMRLIRSLWWFGTFANQWWNVSTIAFHLILCFDGSTESTTISLHNSQHLLFRSWYSLGYWLWVCRKVHEIFHKFLNFATILTHWFLLRIH